MTRFFDAHRDRFAVADMCRVLGWNPSTYYASHNRASSNRALGDADLLADIRRVHHDNDGVYGAPKIWIALNREGGRVARCTVERLMRREGLRGAIRGRPKTTTTPAHHETAPGDLLDRDVTATAPDQWRVRAPVLDAGEPRSDASEEQSHQDRHHELGFYHAVNSKPQRKESLDFGQWFGNSNRRRETALGA